MHHLAKIPASSDDVIQIIIWLFANLIPIEEDAEFGYLNFSLCVNYDINKRKFMSY